MKVLTAAAMREVDRRTIELGVPGIVLMENAGHRVVEFIAGRYAPLAEHRIAVLCGKGNNGGDGMVVARQLFTRFHPRALHVVLLAAPEELKGDAAANYRMLQACGCPIEREIPAASRYATLLVDALLGTGISGPATGRMLQAIREMNSGFPLAKVVAVDIPSGLPSDTPDPVGEYVRAHHTVTFTAPKLGQVLPPNCDLQGELIVRPIGSPESLFSDVKVELVEPAMFRDLLAPRPRWGHKGTFGHVLIVGGSHGKSGAPSMSGMAALRAGAGLVTVASSEDVIPQIASHMPELMTAALDDQIEKLAEGKTVIGIGPGLGRRPELVSRVAALQLPVVFDADALIAAPPRSEHPRILTPHPGEMARLTGKSTAEVQQDRLGAARDFATAHGVTVVLKGERTVIAFPDGRAWINPTGTPALGTGGTGDILTGLISGFLAQFPKQPDQAVAAAVYLGGLAGEIGAAEIGEKPFTATDILRYLPQALSRVGLLACPGEQSSL
jgi:hydroxyethylthiazole kinase-like uncharacterized protein yjeF